MTEFTPGPWKIDPVAPLAVIADNENGDGICEIKGPPEHPENQANARLIAAAPNLLVALKLALSALDNSLRSAGTSTAGFIATRRLMAKAEKQGRTAIAKIHSEGKEDET